MRRYLPVLILLPVLAACRGTQPYTSLDLSQVRTGYAEIKPTYLAFKHAFITNDSHGIRANYRVEQRQCKLVDEIDKRDTIDPNVNLFFASIELDSFCNAIEMAYVDWAKANGYSFPKDIPPSRKDEIWGGTDKELKKMRKYLAHPGSLA